MNIKKFDIWSYFEGLVSRICWLSELLDSDCIPDDEDNACEEAADEIDAINDETFGDDVQGSINSELEDYAAQVYYRCCFIHFILLIQSI